MPDANQRLPPRGSVPLREALRLFLPKLWEGYISVVEVRENSPFPDESMRSEADRAAAWKDEFAIIKMLDKTATALWDRMIEALFAKLQSGDLAAYAQEDPPFGPWRQIFPPTWRLTQLTDLETGQAEVAGKTIYHIHILVPNEGVHMPTGAPGAPSLGMHLIIPEFERRVAEGELESSCAQQGRVLEAWYRKQYPLRQSPKPVSIENKIRDGYRAAKLSAKGNPTKL